MSALSFSTVNELARDTGLSVAGVTGADPLEQDRSALAEWQASGAFGEMAYMAREPELLAGPQRLLPEARSVVLFALRYSSARHPPFRTGFGRVARYAWGRDYHAVLRERLRAFVEAARSRLGRPIAARSFSDSVPLLERALARRAGLGFIGKNTMLIQRSRGSFFFLGEVIWDVEIFELPHDLGYASKCGSCTRCAGACPTGALDREYQLDARKCISYLSIEKRGALEAWERRALGEWVFGCDICQDICPFNHRALKREWAPEADDFEPRQGVGALIDLEALLRIHTSAEFARQFEATPLMRARREGLLRNAACVAANTGAVQLLPLLKERASGDRSAVVRQHALWAAMQLETDASARSGMLDRAYGDIDESVRSEAQYLIEGRH